MGAKGYSEQRSFGRRLYTFPSGFRGIAELTVANQRFIRVTSFRGIPMANVQVRVNNTGGSVIYTTNSEGIATIFPDIATNITIDLRQYNTVRNGTPYNTNTAALVTTIILDTQIHVI